MKATIALALIIGLAACGAPTASTPEPSAIESPLSEDEQFRELAAQKTNGLIAGDIVRSIPVENVIDVRGEVIKAVDEGASVDAVIAIGANSFQKQGHDRELAMKISSGLVNASLEWNATQKP